MFDIFYIGQKPNLFPHEQPAISKRDAQQRSRTRFCWVINYLCDYNTWDFLWEPTPWESLQTHAWPSQWQQDSSTYLIPRLEHTDINYRNDRELVRNKPSAAIVLIDLINDQIDNSKNSINGIVIKTVRFFDNYLDTLIRIAQTSDQEYLWICSSLCDYSNFDFTWHPDPWQQEMLHVFPSNEQKFGDTFYMHVPSFKKIAPTCQLLDWYNINFCQDQRVPRWDIPHIQHTNDSHVDIIKTSKQTAPLAVYSNELFKSLIPTISIWRDKTRTITPLTTRGSTVIVPRDCISNLKTQLWDYPYIDKTFQLIKDQPLDIVFISNGESNAEENWQHLQTVSSANSNRIVRVDGINGRAQAYFAAANASQTPWFFAVFAKLQVNIEFDWLWQPDCLQQPKHYIFHAYNPVNGLEYGHMAMIAYNKNLVLKNSAAGLDFTLDQLHEVIPMLSGVANYAETPIMAWRAAFREVIKLKDSLKESLTIETQYRLSCWLEKGEGEQGYWSRKGAEDAVNYYNLTNGKFELLKLSYEWDWLNNYYIQLHAQSSDQQ